MHTHTPAIQYCRASPEEEPWKLPLWRGLFARRRQTSAIVKPKSVTTNTTNFMSWNCGYIVRCACACEHSNGGFFSSTLFTNGRRRNLRVLVAAIGSLGNRGHAQLLVYRNKGKELLRQHHCTVSCLVGIGWMHRNATYDKGALAGLHSAGSSGPSRVELWWGCQGGPRLVALLP